VSLSHSIDAGLDYVRASQSREGFWSDWQLPPGESNMWTTAYIGYRLSTLPRRYLHQVDENLRRGAVWLRRSECRGGGWGYAEATGPDGDSTSLALLFLGSDATCPQRLHAYQQPDGGFSTYTSDASYGSWVQAHPDVTACALLALLPTPFATTERMAAGVRYLRAQQRGDGLWNAFWWTSCLYSTEAALTFFDAAGQGAYRKLALEPVRDTALQGSLREIPTPTAFETALRLLCLVRLGACGDPLAADDAGTLQSSQHPDGSWSSRAILRLTSRAVCEPWRVPDAGPVFADPQRLFTTATVVAALAAFETA
jgi:hypothetical protein